MTKVKLLVLDDHPILREGITSLFEKLPNIDLVSEAKNRKEALQYIEREIPDVVPMDINMDGELDVNATELIKQKWSDVKVLAFSMHQKIQVIRHMLKSGVSGYILKNASHQEVVKAINTVMVDKTYCSQGVLDIITRSITTNGDNNGDEIVLSNREKEVLHYVVKEFTDQEVADTIHISLRTVETHKRNLIKKLRVKNVVGLVRFALEQRPLLDF